MEAYAQLSASAGVGAVSSQVSATAAVSRPMSDPYTRGSMFRAVAGHAGQSRDSPDGGDLEHSVFEASEQSAYALNKERPGARIHCHERREPASQLAEVPRELT